MFLAVCLADFMIACLLLVYVHNAMAVIFDFIADADWRE